MTSAYIDTSYMARAHPSLLVGVGVRVVAATTHGVVEDADTEPSFTVILEDDDVVRLDLVRAGEALLAIAKVQLAEVVEVQIDWLRGGPKIVRPQHDKR